MEDTNKNAGIRKLSFSRKYDLGHFNNTDMGDSFVEIPAEYALNQPIVENLWLLQMLTVEWAFRKYTAIRKKYAMSDALATLNEQITELEAERNQVFLEIKKLMKEEKENETDTAE